MQNLRLLFGQKLFVLQWCSLSIFHFLLAVHRLAVGTAMIRRGPNSARCDFVHTDLSASRSCWRFVTRTSMMPPHSRGGPLTSLNSLLYMSQSSGKQFELLDTSRYPAASSRHETNVFVWQPQRCTRAQQQHSGRLWQRRVSIDKPKVWRDNHSHGVSPAEAACTLMASRADPCFHVVYATFWPRCILTWQQRAALGWAFHFNVKQKYLLEIPLVSHWIYSKAPLKAKVGPTQIKRMVSVDQSFTELSSETNFLQQWWEAVKIRPCRQSLRKLFHLLQNRLIGKWNRQ